ADFILATGPDPVTLVAVDSDRRPLGLSRERLDRPESRAVWRCSPTEADRRHARSAFKSRAAAARRDVLSRSLWKCPPPSRRRGSPFCHDGRFLTSEWRIGGHEFDRAVGTGSSPF